MMLNGYCGPPAKKNKKMKIFFIFLGYYNKKEAKPNRFCLFGTVCLGYLPFRLNSRYRLGAMFSYFLKARVKLIAELKPTFTAIS